ncbi:hypothetical protein [Nocardia macrotermitis]|uniref:Uncharacterized protein n=1 Tax=Nocardia macrotermitis TaxID=2585198 RepID=A0A7K0DBC6_9NOCA|nr:hypothetical protein [Nocardia macrotermitis]MQY22909.1 hypothetical protein [Nocardia macrotermitis]
MFPQSNNFEELGLKVQRAQQALERIRGVGMVKGIRVTVDAENRLVALTSDEEDIILRAYEAAVADKQAQAEQAIAELQADPRFEAISTFTDANATQAHAARIEQDQRYEEDDDAYFEERNRQGWLES